MQPLQLRVVPSLSSNRRAWGARLATMIACLLLLTLGLPSGATPAMAAENAPAVDSTPPPHDLKELVSLLENEAEREQFLAQLKSVLDARAAQTEEEVVAPTGLASRLIENFGGYTAAFDYEAVIGAGENLFAWAKRQVLVPENQRLWLLGAITLAASYAAAWIALFTIGWTLRNPLERVRQTHPEGWLRRIAANLALLFLRVLPIGAYVVAGYAVALILGLNAVATSLTLMLLLATGADRLLTAVCRVVLLPANPQLGLLPISESLGAYLFVWVRRFGRFLVYAVFTVTALHNLEVDPVVVTLLTKTLGLFLAFLMVLFILQNRRSVRDFFQNEQWSQRVQPPVAMVMARFGDLWHLPAVGLIIAGLSVWLLEVDGGLEYLVKGLALSTLCLLIARTVDVLVRRGLDRMMAIDPEVIRRNPLIEERANRYLPAVRRGFVAAIYLFAGVFVLQSWGIDLMGWFVSDVGQRVVAAAVSIFVTLVVALLIWEGVSALLDSQMQQLSSRGDDRAKRLRTLLPLLRRVFMVIVMAATVLIVLSEIGVNIGPLLAGLGIFGIAVGLASQKVIQDFLNGVLVLFDNSLAIGDKVTIAGRTGIVEDISIRNVTLRNPDGPLYTVPFSEVDVVENLSRDFMVSVSEPMIDANVDIDHVLQVLREAADRWVTEPEFKEHLVGGVDIRGLNGFDDGNLKVAIAAKVKPGSYVPFNRILNKAVYKALVEAQIPVPHQRLIANSSATPVRLQPPASTNDAA